MKWIFTVAEDGRILDEARLGRDVVGVWCDEDGWHWSLLLSGGIVRNDRVYSSRCSARRAAISAANKLGITR